ncbi:hypothetical protein [Krasilnikovia sp. M28-CT-15]|uniref:hypothetical protein n=1 Tax=Krasilnikovia sp. M28-CT-15 TaxID=3373540 RepID=UPI003876601B
MALSGVATGSVATRGAVSGVMSGGVVTGGAMVGGRRRQAVAVPGGPHRPPLRLTRRGEVVVFLFFLALASLASVVLFSTASHAAPAVRPAAPAYVVDHGEPRKPA